MRIVLLPGLHGTTDLFDPFVAAAPPGWDLVPLALPELASYDELQSKVQPLVEEQGECILLAESFAGPLGIRLANSCANARALVLASSFTAAPGGRWLRRFALAPLFALPRPRAAIRAVLCGRDADDRLVDRIRELARGLPPTLIAARLRAVLSVEPRPCTKPLLFLRGTQDRLVPSSVLDSLPADAAIVRIDGPHALLQTKPREAWRAIAEWSASISRTGPPRSSPVGVDSGAA